MTAHSSYFPEFNNETRSYLWNLNNFIEDIFTNFPNIEIFVAAIGLITNTIHLMVLTRKSMMTSSTNVILIGIGIHDLNVILTILAPFVNRPKIGTCDSPPSSLRVHLELFAYSITDFSRRCSLWLGVCLALVRYIVLRGSRKLRPSKLGKLRFGWYIFSIIFVISFLFSIPYHFRLTVVQFSEWIPEPDCGYPENFSLPLFGYQQRSIYYDYDELVLKLNFLLNGIFSKIVPCILFIILGAFLVKELKHAQGSQKFLGRKDDRDKKQRATKLVIYMTISYLVAELPLGIIFILQYVLAATPGFL